MLAQNYTSSNVNQNGQKAESMRSRKILWYNIDKLARKAKYHGSDDVHDFLNSVFLWSDV